MPRSFSTAHLLALTLALPAACGGQSADSAAGGAGSAGTSRYAVVDTGQTSCFAGSACGACPTAGDDELGQDAQYDGVQPRYEDNGDGTVTDLSTGLMWQKNPGAKMTYDEAVAGLSSFDLAGYDDWRLPTIKELYSLIVFSGRDVSGCQTAADCSLTPFIRDDVFDFVYGDTDAGERLIDSQYMSSTLYVSTTMNGDETVFGVNFADGRIKGYGLVIGGAPKTFFVSHVRGNPSYGVNDFVDNGDETISDRATGLTWTKADSGGAQDWDAALAWCEGLSLAGHDDWRLPNAKELQSIVDYTRSPATTGSAAIDPLFDATPIVDEGGSSNFGFYWASTTHATTAASDVAGENAVYVAFGSALGWMQGPNGQYALMDVHGAGAQRSDPKTGSAADYPYGHGPQGDVIRIENLARCVRGGVTWNDAGGGECGGGTGGSGGGGPTTCDVEADCQAAGACPPDAALGCSCSTAPAGGKACIPRCSTDADCPAPPGMALTCGADGLCVPA